MIPIRPVTQRTRSELARRGAGAVREAIMSAPILLDTAEEVSRWLWRHHVTPRQLRQWARRGHITRHPGDLFEAKEVADYLEKRDTRMVEVRQGIRAGQRRDTFSAISRLP